METHRGRACAPSAGGRSTSGCDRSRSRRTGLWLKSESLPPLKMCLAFIHQNRLYKTANWENKLTFSCFVFWGRKYLCVECLHFQFKSIFFFLAFLPTFPGYRLQREEEAAYASSQVVSAPQPGHATLAPFSKFEEKKTNEKTRKVTTVKKFFSPSSRTTSKKGSAL